VSFRVDDGTVHAIVSNEHSGVAYVHTGGDGFGRIAVPTTGGASLRIGDDGRARIAYPGTKGIVLATVSGGKLVGSTIPNSKDGQSPSLILAPNGDAIVAWTRSSIMGGGCIDGEPQPADGTFVSTNHAGTWTTTKLTTIVGSTSIAMDAMTGEVLVVVSDFSRLIAYDRVAGGSWTHRTLASGELYTPTVKVNPVTGNLLMTVVDVPESGKASIQVISRG
jgi:hypothetical protein